MHEMHSLLFAALETFSLVLLRKTSNHIFRWPPVWVCKQCCSSCHSLLDLRPVSHSFRLYMNQNSFSISSAPYLKRSSWVPTIQPCAVPVYPGLQHRDLLQIIVLKLLLFSSGSWAEGRSAMFLALRHPLFQSLLRLWLPPFGPMQPGRDPPPPHPCICDNVESRWHLVSQQNSLHILSGRSVPAAPSPSDGSRSQMARQARQLGSAQIFIYVRSSFDFCHCDTCSFHSPPPPRTS